MTAGLKGHALFAGGHGDGGLARGGPDQLHVTTARAARQAPSDFQPLRQAIDAALASGDYLAYCAARRELLLAQAAAYLARERKR
jgi:hypothetical protein